MLHWLKLVWKINAWCMSNLELAPLNSPCLARKISPCRFLSNMLRSIRRLFKFYNHSTTIKHGREISLQPYLTQLAIFFKSTRKEMSDNLHSKKLIFFLYIFPDQDYSLKVFYLLQFKGADKLMFLISWLTYSMYSSHTCIGRHHQLLGDTGSLGNMIQSEIFFILRYSRCDVLV